MRAFLFRIGWILLICAAIGGIVVGVKTRVHNYDGFNFLNALITWLIGGFSSLGILSFAEHLYNQETIIDNQELIIKALSTLKEENNCKNVTPKE